MDTIIGLLSDFGQFLRPWMRDIATAMVACMLVVFGADINRLLRGQLSGTNFILRTAVFIFVNAFGFGFLIVSAAPWLSRQLSHLPNVWLVGVVVTTFVFIGTWAQRHRQM